MGTPATRISATDFVIPPEFRDYQLSANGSGRIGGVRIELQQSAVGTQLAGSYQQVPLRFLPPFLFGPNEPALLYLLNPTAGLMDGNGHLIELTAGTNTRAVVAGQSATRVHPCLHNFATQQWHVRVEAGATLVVLPGPAIPFEGCRYYQRAEIDLEEGANLIWGDIWFAGRYARGKLSEQFQFQTIVQEFLVRHAGLPVFRDRFCWRGPWDEPTARWHFGTQKACGSLFATGPGLNLSLRDDRARFTTSAGAICVRYTDSSEVVTRKLVEDALQLGQAQVVTTSELAPNHWFSIPG